MTPAIHRPDIVHPLGTFHNVDGYSSYRIPQKQGFWKALFRPFLGSEVYDFHLSPTRPLTFIWPDGRRWQPNRNMISDKGSVPPVAQLVVGGEDHFELGYWFHDSGYNFHGVYEAEKGSDEFRFRVASRSEIDAALQTMVQVEGGWFATARAIYRAVRLFGIFPWNRKHEMTLALRKRKKEASYPCPQSN